MNLQIFLEAKSYDSLTYTLIFPQNQTPKVKFSSSLSQPVAINNFT
jgi:hypothetical protein